MENQSSNKKNRKSSPKSTIIIKHINGIKRDLLDGEKRPVFLEFLKQSNHRNGLYVLYDKKGKLYYIGKATDLKRRLDNHLRDRHHEGWDKMTLFFLSKKANVSELEGLLVATANPPANTQKPKIGIDLRKELFRFLSDDSKKQIFGQVYPDRLIKHDRLAQRITAARLKSLSKISLANALKITRRSLNKLWDEDPNNLRSVRRYIRASGKRDAVLVLIEKLKN